jgi:CheY-like chemotaxis protein
MRILFIDEQRESTRIVIRSLMESGHSVATAPNGAVGMEMVQIMWPSHFDVIAVALNTTHAWDLIESAVLYGFAQHCIAMVDNCAVLDRTQLKYLRIPVIEKPATAAEIIHALDHRNPRRDSPSLQTAV